MLQTTPSSTGPGALSLEPAPRGAVERGGDHAGEFSQEFDKQVKNVEKSGPHKDVAENKTATDESMDEPPVKAETQEKSERAANDDTQGTGSEVVDEEGQGGNNLPLEQMRKMAAEAQLMAESQKKSEATAPELLDEVIEHTDEVVEPGIESLIAIVNPPVQDSGQVIAAAVKGGMAQRVGAEVENKAVAATLVTDEPATEEGELPELQLKQSAKEGDFASLLVRQPKDGRGGEVLPRGDRGFDSLLNLPGRANAASAAIDTLTPTLAPLAGQGASSPLATPLPVAMTLAMPMHQANWGGAVAERVMWMTNANIQEAEIQLHPRELGPIGIKITLNNDQTHVSFVAQNAATREALESALPRLREMFSENGLQLGQSDVSEHSFKGREKSADGHGHDGRGGADDALEGEEALHGPDTLRGVGYATPSGVDAFA